MNQPMNRRQSSACFYDACHRRKIVAQSKLARDLVEAAGVLGRFAATLPRTNGPIELLGAGWKHIPGATKQSGNRKGLAFRHQT